ncbi:MAG: FtsX-like permease family protein, partial [Myxococcota bacterium]
MPRGFGFPRPETEVWYAQDFPRAGGSIDFLQLTGIARLTPRASLESAASELNALIPRLADYGDVTPAELVEAGLAARVEPLQAAMFGDLAGVLWLALAATVLVLAIAAANAANLFLVRAEERRVEIAVRAALGAGRGERIRTFLMEGLVLGAVAGVLAVLLAAALVQGVVALGPTDLPRMHEVGFGIRHGLVTLGIALLLGLVLSAVPALRGMRAGGTSSLRVDQRVAAGPTQRRVTQLLTVGEIAVGFVLLAGAALLLQSFQRLRSVDPGFDSESVLTMEVALPARPYRDGEARFWRTLVERIEALPGVDAAGAAALLPLTAGPYSEDALWEPVLVEHAPGPGDEPPRVPFLTVTPGYFEALRIPVLAG